MMRSVLCFLVLLLCVSSVSLAAQEGPVSQVNTTDHGVSEVTCESSEQPDKPCASQVPASLPVKSPVPPEQHVEIGPSVLQGVAHGGPVAGTSLQRSDAAAHATEAERRQVQDRLKPVGSQEAEREEAETLVNNKKAGALSSLSPEQSPQGGTGGPGSEGQQKQIDRVTQGSQEENRNKETNTESSELPTNADSTQRPTADAPPADTTPSNPHSGDSSTPNNRSAEPNSTADTLTTSEESEGTNNEIANALSESTTTTTTTTLPLESANNKKGDADSSSSISSSVWVRVPLLIVVTLACILVC
ncbi:uncharacterized protein TM35_000471280 [Trypanosoma theileri]|uniref:Mucin-associated surface protein (MASP) n=1 Tax=Trypanosoma theileri TaxID=67003 RepID=A0A1X0NID5_9TRYP|nr:uncharacterized protein TM35_000471280 [Trypanosoma theileri]ORC84233.1 hypothetical protein TM35_000471280 [Trypanosoma theileri]